MLSEATGPAPPARHGPYFWMCGILALYAVVFLFYAEIQAFAFDESYHLLAAQLINSGHIPYIDFCFPQTPLNVYWNAFLMRLLGQSWHVAHAFAALFTIAAAFLTADFVYFRFPVPTWRFAAALTSGLLVGLNTMVFEYGPLGQPYGICLFLLVAAFRAAVPAIDRRSPALTAVSGLFAGMAAASSLLSAAAAPALLGWILFYNRDGRRWPKALAFCGAAAVPFAPVYWLLWLGPQQAWFNLFKYHYYYRKLYWPDTTRHDLEVFTLWIDSGQGLVIGLLVAAGLIYIVRKSAWTPQTKAPLYLCAWVAAALSAEVGRAHPTFVQYFLLTTPFLAMIAVTGMYFLGTRVFEADRPLLSMVLVAGLVACNLAKATYYEIRDTNNWSVYERLAHKIDQVTPRNAALLADEPIYFLLKRTPPPGYELYYTHELKLPPAEASLLHILSKDDVKRQVQSGRFATAFSCDDDETALYELKKHYGQHVDMDDCSIFWGFKK